METGALISIGELARSVGCTTRTLRHFESLGLIEPICRGDGSIRRYAPDAPERLRTIIRLKSTGLTLLQIKEILDSGLVNGTGEYLARNILAHLQTRRQDIAHLVSAQLQLLHEIEESISILEKCLGCQALPGPERCPRCKAVSSHKIVPRILSSINPNMARGSRESGP